MIEISLRPITGHVGSSRVCDGREWRRHRQAPRTLRDAGLSLRDRRRPRGIRHLAATLAPEPQRLEELVLEGTWRLLLEPCRLWRRHVFLNLLILSRSSRRCACCSLDVSDDAVG